MTTQANPSVKAPSSKVRWLFLGVSISLLTMLGVSGIFAARYLDRLHEQEQNASHLLGQRAQALSGLWLSIQNYNQAVEKFIAETNISERPVTRDQLDRLAVEIAANISGYPRARDPMEAALLAELQGVFSQQRTLYVAVVSAQPGNRLKAEQALANQTEQILAWSSKLQAWNGDRIQRADERMRLEFEGLQAGLTKTLAIGISAGLLLVLAGMAYILRLERQTDRRYTELAESRLQLQQLSASLVDAQENERRSISRELHDEVGQSLGALLMDLGRLSTEQPELRERLEPIKAVTERTVDAVRNISLLLRPSMLDDLGLVAALEWQGREVSRHSNIEVEVKSENVPDDLPDEYRVCVYRLVQEALNNAVRHSGARNAVVEVRQSSGTIQVQVEDDGKGFDPHRTRGLGLLGMEERVKRLGGQLEITSGPGVSIKATLPLPPPHGVEG